MSIFDDVFGDPCRDTATYMPTTPDALSIYQGNLLIEAALERLQQALAGAV